MGLFILFVNWCVLMVFLKLSNRAQKRMEHVSPGNLIASQPFVIAFGPAICVIAALANVIGLVLFEPFEIRGFFTNPAVPCALFTFAWSMLAIGLGYKSRVARQ